jgi:hypothetical protein
LWPFYIANFVVYKLEKSWLHIHKPLIYKRYIDDIFIVTKKPLNKIEFSKQFKRLKLRNVGNMDRYSLIKYKDKDNSYLFKNKIIISMKYNENFIEIKKTSL